MLLNHYLDTIKPSGIRKLFDLAQSAKDAVNFGIGEPDFDTPKIIREAAQKAMENGITHYTPNAGFKELREAISEKLLKDNNITADIDEIIVTAGGTASLLISLYTLINPGDEVIIPDPGFVAYENQVKLFGGIPVAFKLSEEDNFHPDIELLKSLITPKTKAIIVNTPSNPTAAVYTKEELEAIAELALKNNIYLICDELYEYILYDGRKHHSIASFPEMKKLTITINGFSKSYAMTGWRLGYIVAEKELIKAMLKFQQNSIVCANSITQMAGITALKEAAKDVEIMLKEYTRRKKFIFKAINSIGGISCKQIEGAFYAFVNIKDTQMSSDELSMYLLKEYEVVTVPGTAFGKYGEGYIRLSFATSMEKIEEGTRRMKEAIEKLR